MALRFGANSLRSPSGQSAHLTWYTCVRRDQDTFQAPPLMVFYPSIAQNLLRNRLFQLPAYKVNAQAFGLKGAYVPWEVGFSGGFAREWLEIYHEDRGN